MTIRNSKNAPTLPESYWAATAILGLDFSSLKGTKKADVCVIGGGFAGLSTALHLASAGVSTVLVEAAEPGWGASGRNGGQIIPGFKAERSELVQRVGEEKAERLFSWSGTFVDTTLDLIKKHDIDCHSPAGFSPPTPSERLATFSAALKNGSLEAPTSRFLAKVKPPNFWVQTGTKERFWIGAEDVCIPCLTLAD